MMDVMFYEVFEEEEKALKRYFPRELKAGFSKQTIQSEPSADPPSRLISIRTQSIVPASWKGKLSGILARSSGYDHLLSFREEQGKDLACGYLPSYCSRSVAEHAITVMFALAKKLKKQTKQFEHFNRDGLTGIDCAGRNLLVVGVGRIGMEVVKIAKGIGMNVRGADLVKRLKAFEYVTLEEGVKSSDVIICALPLTPKTKGLLNDNLLRCGKRGMLFINVSRGEISPIQGLKRLLDEGVLGGIGLDVYEEEPLLADTLRAQKGTLSESGKIILSLKDDDRVIFTPHNAFNTVESLEEKAKQSCGAITAFLKEKKFPDPVPSE